LGGLGSVPLASLLLAVAVLLGATQICGALARRIGQPAVLGELVAGILLGPTLLGRIAPGAVETLFPAAGTQAGAFRGLTVVSIVLFLAVAGLEVDLGRLLARLRVAASVGIAGIVVPFAVGFGCAFAWPAAFGAEPTSPAVPFALFIGSALAITALPVIAKTLVDLDLYRTDFGALVMGAAVLNDVIGWTLFGLVVGLFGHGQTTAGGAVGEIAISLAAVAGALSAGRWAVQRALAWVDRRVGAQGGVVAFVVCLGFASAALTEWLGHGALMGAFLSGVMMGGTLATSPGRLYELERLVALVFAPLFFGSLGLHTDFAANFDPALVVAVVAIASAGKLVGCSAAARWSGLPVREAWAVGAGMNARGAMEMAMALVALQYGIISEHLFVALVVMALVTSALAGPLMKRLLALHGERLLLAHLREAGFLPRLAARDRDEVIRALAAAAAPAARLGPDVLARAVLARESIMPTGVGMGIAIPHARLPGLSAPVAALALCDPGADFGAPDGELARIAVLVLTPEGDDLIQLELLAEVARTLGDAETRRRVASARSFEELSRALRDAPVRAGPRVGDN
jgi:Kef-type K+ transport system membrane component KefB/mannitol/fructose-specific phosphotransferase system IIA component (Ntr-type)